MAPPAFSSSSVLQLRGGAARLVFDFRRCPLRSARSYGQRYQVQKVRACAIPKPALHKQFQAQGIERDLSDRVLSRAESAMRDWSVTTTEFLTPPEAQAFETGLGSVSDVRVSTWGGFSSAERRVLIIGRSDICDSVENLNELVPDELACLSISGNFLFDVASHPDFLGALLGTGLTRQKIGDIIVVGDRGAQVIVRADIADFLTESLTSVRTVQVKVARIPWTDLQVRPPSVKEMTVVEASMRLDAVASAGFSMSRTKVNDLVKAGECQTNYKQVKQPSKSLQTGDVVSIRGKGKLEIGETSLTAKGRHRIQLKRFV